MSIFGRLLDRSIIFSFDRTGFERHQRRFHAGDLDVDCTQMHAVVTGANSGIGFATTDALVRRGATVTMVCRSEARATVARQRLLAAHPGADVRLVLADMATAASVRAAAHAISDPVNVLVHNAGNMLHELTRTDDGLETITALHLNGPYLLSTLLYDRLLAAKTVDRPARIIFVSSGGMYTQKLNIDALNAPPTPYDGTRHYALTKRAQVVLAEQLHARWAKDGVTAHSMHPGWVETPAIRRAMPLFSKITGPILRSAEQGADTVVWLSICRDPDIDTESGFWFDRARAPFHMSAGTRVSPDIEQALIPRMMDWV